MQLGMIGLGRMGSNMVRRLQRGGLHHAIAAAADPDAAEALFSALAAEAEEEQE